MTISFEWDRIESKRNHEEIVDGNGEDTEYVCTKVLGMSSEEFAGLLKEGVFT
jgi:hypothetical protein